MPEEEESYNGTEGQDRDSYSDDQDRENYTVDEGPRDNSLANLNDGELYVLRRALRHLRPTLDEEERGAVTDRIADVQNEIQLRGRY